jgi:hypothetical protein
MLPGTSYLELRPEGWTMRTLLGRRFHYRWGDVERFYTVQDGFSRKVVLNFSPSCREMPSLRSFNAATLGYEGALENYGMRPTDLAALLEQYRKKYGVCTPSAPSTALMQPPS